MIKQEGKMKKWFIILLFLALIPMVSAFNITTDEVTQTSIVWNLSQKPGGVTITEIVLDGITVEGYSSNASRIVQSNLYPGETHIITVIDSSPAISELEVTTTAKPVSQGETLFTTINLYILILLAIIITAFAIWSGIGFMAFIATIITFIGIVGSIGNNFLTGVIFVIMFCGTLWIGLKL